MMSTTDMGEYKPFDRLKLAIVGPPKSGKSRLMATCRKPLLVYDFDDRKESIAGIPGVYVKTPKDEPWPKAPKVAEEMLDEAEKLEASLELCKHGFDAKPGLNIKTVGFDSTMALSKFCLAFTLYQNPKMRREINLGSKLQLQLPSSFDGWVSDMAMVEALMLRFMSLPIDFIMTFHEAAEEAPDSTAESPRMTGKVTVFPVRHRHLIKNFNEVWRLSRTAQVPKVQLIPDYQFTTATCLLVDSVTNPNIEEIILKHLAAEQALMLTKQQSLVKTR